MNDVIKIEYSWNSGEAITANSSHRLHTVRKPFRIAADAIAAMQQIGCQMIDKIFSISSDVRYVAIYRDGELETQTKDNMEGASSSESDK